VYLKFRDSIFKAGTIVLLLVAIITIYRQVGNYSFILYDDEDYVLLNSRLHLGFTFENIRWYSTSAHAANWHPVTWFSHILDVKLFGLNAMGHHYTNVTIHGINSILLFLFLRRFTGTHWRSAAVAALFAVHPLNVESVVWISERKNVLSTMFWMLTIYFYARYTEHKSKTLYVLTISAFILGLMSKQMLVSIPFVLLLLDIWPLQRIGGNTDINKLNPSALRALLLEKVPFLILAIIASVIAVIAQQEAMNSLLDAPLSARVANASISYLQYIRNIFWPTDLAVFYPLFPDLIYMQEYITSTVLLIAATSVIIKFRLRYPALFVGWFWYLITLIPVIGIVKIGLQSMADRYAYIPSIGIFIIAIWGLGYLSQVFPHRRLILSSFACTAIMALSMAAWRQTSYWKDSKTLFTHALETTKRNYIALAGIARTLENDGKHDEAIRKLDETLNIAPLYDTAVIQQGIIYMNRGQLDAAAVKFNRAIQINAKAASAYTNLGITLALQGRYNDAIQNFRSAINLEPRSAAANYNMAFTLCKLGKDYEAISYYVNALATAPTDYECHYNLGIALENQQRYIDATRHFSEALRLKPDFLDAGSSLNRTVQKQKTASRFP
jgi:tetratricopeptide (TPR) repeat protein